MKKSIFTFLMFLTFFSIKTFAQTVTKGYVKYEITEFKLDEKADPQMAMMEGMMKGTKTKLYFSGEKALTKINSMGGMSIIKMIVDKDGNSEMYMDMMGQKFLLKMSKADTEKIAEEHKDKKPEFIHHKDKTKDILGMKAHLVTSKDSDENAPVMELWVTTEIETKGMVSQGMDNEEIGGFPLEYTVSIPGQFSMTTKATKFEKDFDKSVFDFDKTGYPEKSMEDLQNMGMGGGGF